MTKSLNKLGNVTYQQGDWVAARAYHEQSLTHCSQLGNRRRVAIRLNKLANLAYVEGNLVTACTYFERSLAMSYEIGHRQDGTALDLDMVAAELL